MCREYDDSYHSVNNYVDNRHCTDHDWLSFAKYLRHFSIIKYVDSYLSPVKHADHVSRLPAYSRQDQPDLLALASSLKLLVHRTNAKESINIQKDSLCWNPNIYNVTKKRSSLCTGPVITAIYMACAKSSYNSQYRLINLPKRDISIYYLIGNIGDSLCTQMIIRANSHGSYLLINYSSVIRPSQARHWQKLCCHFCQKNEEVLKGLELMSIPSSRREVDPLPLHYTHTVLISYTNTFKHNTILNNLLTDSDPMPQNWITKPRW